MSECKAEETRIRRAAEALGWRIEKSRVRNLHANNLGLYQLINECNVVIGGDRYDATLDQCSFWIEEERVTRADVLWSEPGAVQTACLKMD